MCSVKDCLKEEKIRGYCSEHYQKFRRSKEFSRAYNGRNKCKIGDCRKVAFGHGYCSKHYYKFIKYGDALRGISYKKYEEHGKWETTEYRTYAGMLNRYYDPGSKNYPRFCDEWQNSFKKFLEYMGTKPFPKAQIDRINNDGDYEPGNCRWTTNLVNSRNRHNSVLSLGKAEQIKDLLSKDLTSNEIANIVGVKSHNVNDIKEIWL